MTMTLSRNKIILAILCIFVIGFILGFLVNFIRTKEPPPNEKAEKLEKLTRPADEKWSSILRNSVNAANIRSYLKSISKSPRLAGTPADKKTAEDLVSFWQGLGIKSHISRYDVLLSYPDADNPNRIELQNGNGDPIFITQLHEKILRPEENQSNIVPPYNAYAAPGTPKGDLVYVNFGRIEDFLWLKEEKSFNFTGKICIVRYGKIFRGDKAKHAEQFGAQGLIIYSDPAESAQGNTVFPQSWFLPPTGVQRGSLSLHGDPLTQGYPALESAYRINENETNLPRIPVHPISYGDAYMLLKDLAGEAAPTEWQGGLNFTYRLGPGFTQSENKIQMFISTQRQMASVHNAFGIIKGAVEPDRYVLLGNHRDAWVKGATDAGTGTSAMMELSRVFSTMTKKGWKPRRTIILCSWAAEEFSLIGSREFVEEYRQMLSSRAVAYINVDNSVHGRCVLDVGASPLLFDIARNAAKKISNPDVNEVRQGRKTIYSTWLHRTPEIHNSGRTSENPRIHLLGSGSDYVPFISNAGIAALTTEYIHDEQHSSYPLYHSAYDTFYLVDKFIDPGFKFHKAVTQYWGEMVLGLADSLVLPMSVTDYSNAIQRYVNTHLSTYGDIMRQHGLSKGIDYLIDEVDKMKVAAAEFESRLMDIDQTNPIEVRMYNDQIMQLERVFIDPLGLPDRPYTKHVVMAPSIHNTYAGSAFPGLVDSMFRIEQADDMEEEERWSKVEQQLSVVTYFVHAAANYLKCFCQL